MIDTIKWKPTDYEVVTDYDGTVIVRRSDGASIPTDPRNVDYYDFLQVEKADEKSEIKRTTLLPPKQEDIIDPVIKLQEEITSLKKRITSLESTKEDSMIIK